MTVQDDLTLEPPRWTLVEPKPFDAEPRLAHLRERERALGLLPDAPVLVSPQGEVDVDLIRYVRSGNFRRLATGTRTKYLQSLCLLFDSVGGKDWRQVTVDDIEAFQAWRISLTPGPGGTGNPAAVKAQTYNSQFAGLQHLYKWADRRRLLPHGDPTEEHAGSEPQGVDKQPVRWLTTAAFQRFVRIGFQGYLPNGLRDPAYRSRTEQRDVAVAAYGWQSGLRISELTGLLTCELPDVHETRKYYRGRVNGKGGKVRDYWVGHWALQQTLDYLEFDRAESVTRAQDRDAYDDVPGRLLVVEEGPEQIRVVESRDPAVPAGQVLALIDRSVRELRHRLFRVDANGLAEPMQLWLTHGGMPASASTLQSQFRDASARCLRHVPKEGLRVTPHMLRHSYALHMLLGLWQAMRLRAHAAGVNLDEVNKLYGDQWVLVQQLLGHASRETTERIYLAPMQGLVIDDLLNDDDLTGDAGSVDTLVARVARRSKLVLDLGGLFADRTYPEDEPENAG